jgi:hypothetical protein
MRALQQRWAPDENQGRFALPEWYANVHRALGYTWPFSTEGEITEAVLQPGLWEKTTTGFRHLEHLGSPEDWPPQVLIVGKTKRAIEGK